VTPPSRLSVHHCYRLLRHVTDPPSLLPVPVFAARPSSSFVLATTTLHFPSSIYHTPDALSHLSYLLMQTAARRLSVHFEWINASMQPGSVLIPEPVCAGAPL